METKSKLLRTQDKLRDTTEVSFGEEKDCL